MQFGLLAELYVFSLLLLQLETGPMDISNKEMIKSAFILKIYRYINEYSVCLGRERTSGFSSFDVGFTNYIPMISSITNTTYHSETYSTAIHPISGKSTLFLRTVNRSYKHKHDLAFITGIYIFFIKGHLQINNF